MIGSGNGLTNFMQIAAQIPTLYINGSEILESPPRGITDIVFSTKRLSVSNREVFMRCEKDELEETIFNSMWEKEKLDRLGLIITTQSCLEMMEEGIEFVDNIGDIGNVEKTSHDIEFLSNKTRFASVKLTKKTYKNLSAILKLKQSI